MQRSLFPPPDHGRAPATEPSAHQAKLAAATTPVTPSRLSRAYEDAPVAYTKANLRHRIRPSVQVFDHGEGRSSCIYRIDLHRAFPSQSPETEQRSRPRLAMPQTASPLGSIHDRKYPGTAICSAGLTRIA